MNYLLIASGSALGGLARHLVTVLSQRFSEHFPWGTFLVNATGCLIIGFVAAAIPVANHSVRLFLMTGFLGGFTTFSAYSLQGLILIQQGKIAAAVGYLAGSVVTCLVAVAVGYWFGQMVLQKAA
jgi:CrcB protein